MAKRIIGIILVIAALGTVLLGIKAGGAAPENKKIIESATVVSDGKVLPENEGKVKAKTGRKTDRKPMSEKEKTALIERLTAEMKTAAKNLEFEQAAFLRDKIRELKGAK